MQNTLEALIAETAATAKPLCIYGGVAELPFVKLIQAGGGTPVNNDWPDFALFGKDNRMKAVVEVKPNVRSRSRWKPRSNQVLVLIGLASLGLPCFIWTPTCLFRINKDGTAQAVSIDALTTLF